MFDTDYSIYFAFFTSLFVTYFAIPKVILFAEKYRLSDVPGERASHEKSVPIFGGVAIFSGILLSLLFWGTFGDIQVILISLLLVFFVGWYIIDDLLSLSPLKKLLGLILPVLVILLGLILPVLVIIYFGDIQIDSMHGVLGVKEMPDLLATLFTIFVVIVITNSFNLIDGVDGLAAGIGFIASFSFGFLSFLMQQVDMAIIAFSLSGALLAFLKYNFNPARIFMGDTGSLLVGMILSILAINLIGTGLVIDTMHMPNKGPLLAIVFLAIPLFDSLRVFIVRISDGRHPLYPGRGHIHHALLDLGVGHKKTAVILYLVSCLLILGSYFLLEFNINIGIILVTIVSYTMLIIPFYLRRKKQ